MGSLSTYSYRSSSTHMEERRDTLGDMLEAERVGVGAIGVSWGFQKHGTLAKGNPFKVVDEPEGLPVAVEEYFHGKPER